MPDDMRATLVALIVPVIHRPCPRCGRPEPATTGDQVDCSTCLDSGSAGPIFDKADAEEYAERIAAAMWAEVGPELKRLRKELAETKREREQARRLLETALTLRANGRHWDRAWQRWDLETERFLRAADPAPGGDGQRPTHGAELAQDGRTPEIAEPGATHGDHANAEGN